MPAQGQRQNQSQETVQKGVRRPRPRRDPYGDPVSPLMPGDDGSEDTPRDGWDDEDFEEGGSEAGPDLDRSEATNQVIRVRPRPSLAIVKFGGSLHAVVQGLRPGHETGFDLQKIGLLRLIGECIVNQGVNQGTRLSVTKVAEAASQRLGDSQTNKWKSRISKIKDREWVEMPDGTVRPLAEFFQRGPGRRTRLKPVILEILAQHPTDFSAIAQQYRQRMNMPPDSRLKDSVRKRISRLIQSLGTIEPNDVQAIEQWLTRQGFPATPQEIGYVQEFLQARATRQAGP